MKIFRHLSIVLVILFTSTACSIIGVNKWNAYQIIIEVKDSSNQILMDAVVTSDADKIVRSEISGTYSLLYSSTGLHVVTISAPNKMTKQIKLNMPLDNEKIMTIILKDV